MATAALTAALSADLSGASRSSTTATATARWHGDLTDDRRVLFASGVE